MSSSVALALPLIEPLDPGQRGLDADAIREFVACSGLLTAHDPTLYGCKFAMQHIEAPGELPVLAPHWHFGESSRVHSALVVETDVVDFVDAFHVEMRTSHPHFSETEIAKVAQGYAIQNVGLEVANLLLLANVLRPGALSTAEGFGFFEGALVCRTQSFYAEEWSRALFARDKYNWPKFTPVTIAQAWDWLRTVNCFDDGIARGRTGRALAALSYLAPPRPESGSSMNLAWVLLGLEALYASGNVGLREQLVAKTELVLGPRSENKKAFGAMYDFRSRLLHGDIDLPLRYTPFDAVPYFERHIEELGDFEGLGLAALVATIQVMINNSLQELGFRYAIEAKPISHPQAG